MVVIFILHVMCWRHLKKSPRQHGSAFFVYPQNRHHIATLTLFHCSHEIDSLWNDACLYLHNGLCMSIRKRECCCFPLGDCELNVVFLQHIDETSKVI